MCCVSGRDAICVETGTGGGHLCSTPEGRRGGGVGVRWEGEGKDTCCHQRSFLGASTTT